MVGRFLVICFGSTSCWLLSLRYFKKSKKEVDRKKKAHRIDGTARSTAIGFLVISILVTSFMMYCSLDLIKKDYVTTEAKYIGQARTFSYYFSIDGKMISLADSLGASSDFKPEPDETYIITYSKRTFCLISVNN